jgi:splicing factor 1
MESESGAKIAIRGKGSVKEGKGRSDAAHTSNQEEDLHCLIMADTEDKVNKAKELIHNVIETAASIPEGQNELKRNQLRELAALNGTLRDDENQACQNCESTLRYAPQGLTHDTGGQIGHRKYDCPEQRNFTANIICRVCGNAGHMARDCPDRQRGSEARNQVPGYGAAPRRIGAGDAVDREMEVCIIFFESRAMANLLKNLMQELSGNPSNGTAGQIEAAPSGNPWDQGGYGGGDSARPWESRPPAASGGSAAPWARDRQDNYGSGGGAAPAPWAQRQDNGGYGGYGGAPGAPGAPGSGAAPWQSQAPPPPPGGSYGYSGYPGYDQSGYGGAPAAPPPGLSDFLQQYSQQAPPPPPSDIPAPPPGQAPPPPPGDAPPPPPPA